MLNRFAAGGGSAIGDEPNGLPESRELTTAHTLANTNKHTEHILVLFMAKQTGAQTHTIKSVQV